MIANTQAGRIAGAVQEDEVSRGTSAFSPKAHPTEHAAASSKFGKGRSLDMAFGNRRESQSRELVTGPNHWQGAGGAYF